MFTSDFREGDSTIRTVSSRIPADITFCPRRAFQTVENFEILYTILYYLYSDEICFSTDWPSTNSPDMPPYCNPEDIYEIAHRFQLQQLEEKALFFLRETCDVTNIITRVFGVVSLSYEKVGAEYGKFFHDHWDEIKVLGELEEVLEEVDEDQDIYRRKAVYKKYRELIRELR